MEAWSGRVFPREAGKILIGVPSGEGLPVPSSQNHCSQNTKHISVIVNMSRHQAHQEKPVPTHRPSPKPREGTSAWRTGEGGCGAGGHRLPPSVTREPPRPRNSTRCFVCFFQNNFTRVKTNKSPLSTWETENAMECLKDAGEKTSLERANLCKLGNQERTPGTWRSHGQVQKSL